MKPIDLADLVAQLAANQASTQQMLEALTTGQIKTAAAIEKLVREPTLAERVRGDEGLRVDGYRSTTEELASQIPRGVGIAKVFEVASGTVQLDLHDEWEISQTAVVEGYATWTMHPRIVATLERLFAGEHHSLIVAAKISGLEADQTALRDLRRKWDRPKIYEHARRPWLAAISPEAGSLVSRLPLSKFLQDSHNTFEWITRPAIGDQPAIVDGKEVAP